LALLIPMAFAAVAGRAPAGCTLTITGAHSTTVPCVVRISAEPARNITAVTINGDGAHLVVRVRGSLSATRLASDDAVSGAALGYHTRNGAYWYYNRDVGGRGIPRAGSYELVLRSATSGSFSAQLPSGKIGGGVVTVTARFE